MVKIIFIIVSLILVSFNSCLGKEKLCDNCYYGITRNNENEYLMIKNILNFLIENHYNITLDLVNDIGHSSAVRKCDSNVEYMCVKQTIQKDFRHPTHLFKGILHQTDSDKVVYKQYEEEWYRKYKLIYSDKQDKQYTDSCNEIGLRIYCFLYDYKPFYRQAYCKTVSNNQEEITSILLDYYIAQSLIKNCAGNLEMIARGLNKILKYDCNRAYSMKIAYFSSKYLNLIRTCTSDLNVNELMGSLPTDCSNNMKYFRNTRLCIWYEAICRHPITCLMSKNWIDT